MPSDSNKVGVFGGSFDPIHNGHLTLAKELARARGLDEVWFIPAKISPCKLDRRPAPIQDRIEMVRLAIADISGFKVLDIEARLPEPSYTIDTLKVLVDREIEKSNPKTLYLILSDEAAASLQHWKSPEEIIRLVPLLVGSRNKLPQFEPPPGASPSLLRAIEQGWTPTKVVEVSSTDVRQRIREGKDCGGLVPQKVLDYIYRNHLYY